VKLLLATGKVDPKSKDNNSQIPRWKAAVIEREVFIKLLLDTGKTDTNLEGSDGQILLSCIWRHRYEVIVKLLQESFGSTRTSLSIIYKDQNNIR
jgi:hypothetical protein